MSVPEETQGFGHRASAVASGMRPVWCSSSMLDRGPTASKESLNAS